MEVDNKSVRRQTSDRSTCRSPRIPSFDSLPSIIENQVMHWKIFFAVGILAPLTQAALCRAQSPQRLSSPPVSESSAVSQQVIVFEPNQRVAGVPRPLSAWQEEQSGTPPDGLQQGNRSLKAITLDVAASVDGDRVPQDYSTMLFPATDDSSVGHRWESPGMVHTWDAANIWHQPLYFDDPILERYGQTPLPQIQPALSAAHFFGTIPLLPYKMAIDRPFDCVSTLGYYRPGDPTPCLSRRLPRDPRAFAWESGAWLGLVFLVP